MATARIVRGAVLCLKEKEFVEAARAVGATRLADHLAPPGPQLHRPDHGLHDLHRGRGHRHRVDAVLLRLRRAAAPRDAGATCWPTPRPRRPPASGGWWCSRAWRSLITILCVNFIGDGLRDALDPKQASERRLMADPVLERRRDLHVSFPTETGWSRRCGVSISTSTSGELLGVVGESGSGKSVTLPRRHGPAAPVGADHRIDQGRGPGARRRRQEGAARPCAASGSP